MNSVLVFQIVIIKILIFNLLSCCYKRSTVNIDFSQETNKLTTQNNYSVKHQTLTNC